MSISNIVQFCPTSCLYFIGNHILAGQGSYIFVYDSLNCTNVVVEDALNGYTIHGIKEQRSNDKLLVCVFGEKALRIGTFDTLPDVKIIWHFETELFEDWIWDIQWLHEYHNQDCVDKLSKETECTAICSKLSLALGHNYILIWDFKTKTILDRIHCEEKCILYSATFIGKTLENLILASGTVFNHVVLWPAKAKNCNGPNKILHRLTGHQGVIFSIFFNRTLLRLCSTSDDRSLRLWQLVCTKSNLEESSLTLDIWEEARFDLIYVLYGHEARVWSALLLTHYIVSVGEDATCIIWDYSGQIVRKFKVQKSKNIWSIAVNSLETMLVTGGGDCSIRLWNINQETGKQNIVTREVPPVEILSPNDYPRSVAFYGLDVIIVTTMEGCLYLHDLNDDSVKVIMNDPSFRSYCGLHTSPSKDLIAVSNQKGTVKVFRLVNNLTTDTVELMTCSGKVLCLIWPFNNDDFFITCGPEGVMIGWNIISIDSKLSVTKCFSLLLPHSKQQWITSALILENYSLIICGDRCGSIHVYQLPLKDCSERIISPFQSFFKIHGNAGVTDICYFDNSIFSTGRDGFIRMWGIENNILFELNAAKPVQGFEWIAKLLFLDGQLTALAFHGTSFIMWNCAKQQKLLEIPCGGGHRSWDFFLFDHQPLFLYLKSSTIIICQSSLTDLKSSVILKPRIHGREIHDVQHLDSFPFRDKTVHLLVTGSEDTTINIVSIEESYLQETCVSSQILLSLQRHLSNVRTLFLYSGHFKSENIDYKLLFSGGGRAELKCWQLKLQLENSKTKVFSKLLNSYTLGSTKKKKNKPWKLSHLNIDPETRIMNLSGFCLKELKEFPEADHLYVIAAACSDGCLRIFGFNEKSCKFLLIGESHFHDHCLLKVICRTFDSQSLVLSASTDGMIAVWNVNKQLSSYVQMEASRSDSSKAESQFVDSQIIQGDADSLRIGSRTGNCNELKKPELIFKAHQSGVNSMHLQYLKDPHLLLSGGDDGAIFIALLHIEVSSKTILQPLQTFTYPEAHAAQITGITFIPEKQLILTCAVDQRICTWQINWTEITFEIQIQMNSCYLTNIADISSMVVWKDRLSDNHMIAVCGEGLQILRLQ